MGSRSVFLVGKYLHRSTGDDMYNIAYILELECESTTEMIKENRSDGSIS